MSKSWEEIRAESCECIYHRYKTVYICGCGKLISHSQADWNEHKLHPNGINIDSIYYEHGMTMKGLFDKMHVYGLLPYGTSELDTIYTLLANE